MTARGKCVGVSIDCVVYNNILSRIRTAWRNSGIPGCRGTGYSDSRHCDPFPTKDVYIVVSMANATTGHSRTHILRTPR